MKKIIQILFLSFCLLSSALAQAQTINISGKVTDATGEPLPGVSLVVEGTTIGTISDLDGVFTLDIPSEAKFLEASFLGFTTQRVEIGNKTYFEIALQETNVGLEELVVIGYGSQKKESVLGAINQIKSEELQESGSANLTNALSGISPGLTVIQTSGQPGAEEGDIYIRGNSDPLILVDGVEVLGGFSNIDPSDVESISTLKDGAATAVYGIRGANGVIIITTKRGKVGKPRVSLKSEYTLKDYVEGVDPMDAYTAQTAWNAGALNDQSYISYSSEEALQHWKDGDLPYMYPNTNWVDLMTKNFATSLNQNLSVRGGNKFVSYFASAGYLQEGDIFKSEQLYDYDPEYKFKRYSFRANLDFTLTKTTKLKTSFSNRLDETNSPKTTTSILALYITPPGQTVPYYPEEVMEQYPDENYPGVTELRYGFGSNLYKNMNASGINETKTTVFSSDFELEQKLDFITPGLKFTAKYNYISKYTFKSSVNFDTTIEPQQETYTLLPDGTWSATEGVGYEKPLEYIQGSESVNSTEEITYYRGQFNYVRSFGKHNVTGLALFSRNKKVSGTAFPYYNEDWVGRATYNYDAKYFAEVSGSYNGDETFAEGYRFKFFPSFALGVNLAKQELVKNIIPSLNNFKIRYSYGQTGSKSGLGSNRWQYLSYYDYDSSSGSGNTRYWFGYNLNEPLTVIAETQIGNTTLTWATVTKQNIGVDFGLYDNRISGSVEFFKDNRDGLIERLSAEVPAFYGSSADLPFANTGSSESHGYEVSLTYKNTTEGGFNYSANAFYAFYENRILSSALDGAGTPSYATVAGKPAGASTLLQDDGYFQSIDEVVNYPDIAGGAGLGDYRYIDYNANGTILADDTEDNIRYDLPKSPKNSLGLRLGCSYKGWSLSALISGTIGHEGLVNENLAYALSSGVASGTYEQLDYWTSTNTDAAYPAIHTSTTNPNLLDNTAMIVDLDYIKLRSMSLAYNFDMDNIKRISSLQLYVNGNNLLTFSHLDYGDPEGYSPGSYPVLRRINLGLKMTL